ncbi:TPA: hypothetical protein N0F65_007708 [Lagenidium giganteum]|uniref:Cytochrome b5 heme-binding domain-containing protein n=1 Tax=Lagenidium giganteum TaxID=4803 RepID=A0AAV2Z3E2_9STRA|nr:TPA: hypothetical protein N0F65_007708 [Lagenidium giganteum]
MTNAPEVETAPLLDDTDAAPAAPAMKEFTEEEIAKHNTAEDCWMIIENNGDKYVYDVTKFLDDHPGGPEILLDRAGQDATDDFDDIGHSNEAKEQLKDFVIGRLAGAKKSQVASKTGASSSSSTATKPDSGTGSILIVLSVVIAVVALFMQFRPVQ